ncbi:ankyrin repeat domain-containing protein SOWAHD [Ornithorhynchus anatinus]|uniref:ankyrin repeat domain-containing protein SOWAHD n=1 Tax=Ornithorhynchus anatinus TaxID=9258 RepID=UPI0010A75E0E|nr:ankyrin repeat domain-containing protein SOWAHD [Ornithorhynchus anatinus]
MAGLPGGADRPPEAEAEAEAEGPRGRCPRSGRLGLEPWEHGWMLAAAEGRLDLLREAAAAAGLAGAAVPALLARPDPVTGYSALHWLAKHGRHEELVAAQRWAQGCGAELGVSAAGGGGLTPLHLAAGQGHELAVKVLVGALGADPTRRDHGGRRACHYLPAHASPDLRDLAGAEDLPLQRPRPQNANNNCSGPAPAAPAATEERRDGTPSPQPPAASRRLRFLRQVLARFRDP